MYWKPIWHVLEDDFELLLVNARHVKQVPGRKTDVERRGVAVPAAGGRAAAGELRAAEADPRRCDNLTRYRKTQIEERQREANRLHKALEDTGIKLDCVATDILGNSGRAMLDALVAGTTDPERARRAGQGPAAREAPRAAGSAGGPLRRPARAARSARSSRTSTSSTSRSTRLSDAIEEQIAPFAAAVELLCTIPGVHGAPPRSSSPRSAPT